MSKITRLTQKIFGSNAGSNGIAQFGSPANGGFAEATTPAQAQALQAWLDGWSSAALAGSEIPTFQDANAIPFNLSSQIAYILQEGIPEYDAGTQYHEKSIVKKAGTYELYGSKIDDNTGNALPSQADNTQWEYLGLAGGAGGGGGGDVTQAGNNAFTGTNSFANTTTLNGALNVGAGQTLDFGANRLRNIADAVANTDAVTLQQANSLLSGIVGGSFGTNGYVDLNGLRIQWFLATLNIAAGATKTFNYPVAMASAVYQAYLSGYTGQSDPITVSRPLWTDSLNTSSVTIKNSSSNATWNGSGYFLAIGNAPS